MAIATATEPAGIAAISRAVVSAAAEFVVSVERAVVGESKVRTARGNAWDAVQADRARAQARDEVAALVRTLLANGARTDAAASQPAPPSVPRRGANKPTNRGPATRRRRSDLVSATR